ncbi:MAG: CheR family methyltransferase [Rickettsiales bacterium]
MAQTAVQREFEFKTQDFKFIASLVYDKTGIVLADHKQDMVYSRIARRLRNLNLHTFRDYCELLQNDDSQEEMANFVNAITTNLTSFFREKHHFVHLRDEVLKPFVNSKPKEKRLRIWSSACSSGAEPYSIAMTCCSAIQDIANWDVKILATDIDTGMLNKSRNGEYKKEEIAGIPDTLRKKHVVETHNDIFQISPSLRSLIRFKQLNLIEPWPFKGPLDVVFCRNVIIYFDKETQQKLFTQMASRIKKGGWLYLGHSETLHGISDQFELIGKTIYRKVV